MSRKEEYEFHAELQYVFRAHYAAGCQHCGLPEAKHLGENKCPFEPKMFAQHKLKEFFDKLMYGGGVLTITSGDQRITQEVTARAVDAMPHNTSATLSTKGPVTLEVNVAPER